MSSFFIRTFKAWLLAISILLKVLSLQAMTCSNLFLDASQSVAAVNKIIAVNERESRPYNLKNIRQNISSNHHYRVQLVDAKYSIIDLHGQVIHSLESQPESYEFSSDGQYFIYQAQQKNQIMRFNLHIRRLEKPLSLPAGLKLVQVVDSDTFIARQYLTDYNLLDGHFTYPAHYAVVKVVPGLFYGTKAEVISLETPIKEISRPDAASFVVLNDQKTHAAIFNGHYLYNKNSRMNSHFKFRIVRLSDGHIIFDDKTAMDRVGQYNWSQHISGSGLDAITFNRDQLIISGFERKSAHTIVDIRKREVKIYDDKKTADSVPQLTQIKFDHNQTMTVETILNGKNISVQIEFKGFNNVGWGLQEQFQYSLINEGKTLLVTQNSLFVVAVDLLSNKSISYEEILHMPGLERSLLSLLK